MKRRTFLTLLGGAAASGTLAARAQQAMRRVAVLIGTTEDAQSRSWLGSFQQGLQRLGWSEGRNIRIDYRFAGGRLDQVHTLVRELIELRPDVILSQGTAITSALQKEAGTIPIVFMTVSDPIGSGYVASLARPGGNLTGLLMYEDGIAGKWLAMLKEVVPETKRVALIASPSTAYDYYVRAATVAASSLSLDLVPLKVKNAADIESAYESFAGQGIRGLVSAARQHHRWSQREQVVALPQPVIVCRRSMRYAPSLPRAV